MESKRNTYDELPYPSVAIAATSPARLSTVSRFHGGPVPPAREYRALEMGCANGANLLPLAFYNPNAEFVGVDSSGEAIRAARAAAAELGLGNVRFELVDLSDPGPLLDERFHYVLAHGVFSWVDDEVRRGILEICGACPEPDGLVYLSHNVRAGWQVRILVREMLIEAVAGVEPLRERVRKAREVAAEFRAVLGESDHAQQVQLAFELDRVIRAGDSYLFHEYLLPVNRPYDHREVVELLRGPGLAYLADAQFNEPAGRTPEPLRRVLDRNGYDGVRREQMIDLLGCRTFRSSVFCRRESRRPVDEEELVDALAGMFVASSLRPEEDRDPDLHAATEEPFVDVEGNGVSVVSPLMKAALCLLAGRWPRPIGVRELLATAAAALPALPSAPDEPREVRRTLAALYREGLVEIRPGIPSGVRAPAAGRPHALARQEARRGPILTTAYHLPITLKEVDRQVVLMLGGEGPPPPEVDSGAVKRGEISVLRTVGEYRTDLARWGLLEPPTGS